VDQHHRRGKRSSPTIRDVAARAGVSIATVSRVVNGDERVGPEIRDAVTSAIAELGYRPNYFARSLRSARTRSIAVLFPDLGIAPTAVYIAPIERAVRDKGYLPVFGTSYGDLAEERNALQVLQDRNVDGIIWLPVNLPRSFEDLDDIRTPVVLNNASSERFSSVGLDVPAFVHDAVRILARLGHRRLGYIHSANYAAPNEWREGFTAAAKAEGVEVASEYCRVFTTPDESADGLRALLECSPPPTAMLVSSFFVPAAYFTLARAGIRVPEDISIISGGDGEHVRFLSPRPDVLHVDYEERARLLVDLLIDQIEGRITAPVRILQHSTYLQRESTLPAKRD